MHGQIIRVNKYDTTKAEIGLSEVKYITIAVDSLANMIWDIKYYKRQMKLYSDIAIALDSIKRIQDTTIDVLRDEIKKKEPSFWDRTKFYFGLALGILITITSNILVSASG